MLTWYREVAPMRQKLFLTFCLMTGLVSLATICASLGTFFGGLPLGLGLGAVVAGLTGIAGAWCRTAISDPYVTTVVRMEGLAAGDLSTPILFTTYGDCVGRLTKAMFTFRDAAVKQIEQAAEQKLVVDTLGESLSDLSNRDLTSRINADFVGGFAVLKDNFNGALDSVRATIQQVSESAASIQTGSSEIARASEDLARRTEGNAASLEETSAALTQIEERLKATATASLSTAARADQAMETVGAGRSTAEQAKQSMSRVSGSAKGIDSVIEGLDKIAFQTRVLAMNAAVEAGRAGDAGRGFAVVADLVSALAMRAEEEAKRARDQLTVTQAEIISAVDAVGKVDTALEAILGDVTEVNKLLAGMATDNQAQSLAITEITAAIASMDVSSQQNAAMVEETSAAARNLTTEVDSLASASAQFKFERRVRNVAVAIDRRGGGRHLPSAIESQPRAGRAMPQNSRRASERVPVAAEGEWASF